MKNKSAVLLLIFNRPDCTTAVFEAIKRYQPSVLYVAADGPRTPAESEVCDKVRALIKPDWDCELITLYRDVNLGCKKAVSEGITWFFNQVEEGIVLEDDCLPSSSFFDYCEILLEKYRNEPRIAHIAGSNFQDGIIRGDGSYYFSKLTYVWGWASWRRTWDDYDPELTDFNKIKPSFFKRIPSLRKHAHIWMENLRLTASGKVDTWDYQYAFSNLKHKRVSIVPNVNLIKNIGFGRTDATHTSEGVHPLIANGQKLEQLHHIVHPKKVEVSWQADRYSLQKEYSAYPKRKNWFSRTWKAITKQKKVE